MSPTALETLDDLTVNSMTSGPQQARVLQALHEVPVDSEFALAVGDEVTYTDPELGLIFVGKIVTDGARYIDGEGWEYTCADAYRTLSKEPALLGGSTRIKTQVGATTKAVLDSILSNVAVGILPGGYDTTDVELVNLPEIEQAGQTIGDWIDEVLQYTEDTMAWVIPNAGSPKLVFTKASDLDPVTLEIGSFVNPKIVDGGDPLLEQGDIGESTDRKFSRILLEGCGEFTRHVLKNLDSTAVATDAARFLWTFRFHIPEKWATGRYLDASGKCREELSGRISVGWLGPNPATFDLRNLTILGEPGSQYFQVDVRLSGVFFELPPPEPFITGWFTYTSYDGPFKFEKVSPNAALAKEGAYVEQHDEFVKYNAAVGSVDDTSKMSALADALYPIHSEEPDATGNTALHIAGNNTNVVLGAVLDNTEFSGQRINGITYNLAEQRSISLELSDQPVRIPVRDAKLQRQLRSVADGNNTISQTPGDDKSCLCGGTIHTDENEDQQPNTGARPDDPPRRAWDCIQGECEERDGGPYGSFEECKKNCTEFGWDCVPCAGCMPSDVNGWGQYATEAECDAACTPFAPAYSCGSSGDPGSAPNSTSDQDVTGKDYVCSGCYSSGGQPFIGFVKKIETDRGGNVKAVTCAGCNVCDLVKSCVTLTSGYTGSVDVVCSVARSCNPPGGTGCEAVIILVYKQPLFYKNGLLISVGNCGGP